VLLPFYVFKYKVDKLVSLNNIGVFLLFRKNIILVHDLIHWRLPEYKKGLSNFLLRILQFCTIKTAGWYIAISEGTRDDLVKIFHIRKEKVSIIHNGIDQDFFKPCRSDQQSEKQYIFSFSSFLPHKNFERLVRGYAKSGIEADLIIAGKDGETRKEIEKIISELKLKDRVRIIIYPED